MMLGSCYDQDPGWGGVGGMRGSDTLAMAEAPAATHRQAKCYPTPQSRTRGPCTLPQPRPAPDMWAGHPSGWGSSLSPKAPGLVWWGSDCHLTMSSRGQGCWGAWR